MRRTESKFTTMDFRRDNFSLFMDVLGRIPWLQALQERVVQESWLISKYQFLQAQKCCILMSKKLVKGGKRPVWMNKELLLLKPKQEIHKR